MATTLKSNLNFAELDFATIKDSLKEFLRQQDTLKDYDFDGAVSNILLDVLAYNTQYNAFYLNMIAGEMFLSSAQRRDNVVARAKEMGYVPRSARCATATVRLHFTTGGFSIPAGQVFTSQVNGTTYRFVTTQPFTPPTGSYVDVEIRAGTPLTNERVVQQDENGYTIPSAGVDTSTLQVFVNSGANFNEFFLNEDLNENVANSNVYFLEEVADEKFRVYFGDDQVGAALVAGYILRLTYLVSAGTGANGASEFNAPNLSINGNVFDHLEVIQSAYGASEIESIESIKLRAPLEYETQNRAVTAKDYQNILLRDYPFIQSARTWGGEDNDPVRLGYVFMAVKPVDGFNLTQIQKDQIVSDFKSKYSVVTIEPVVVDPDYIYLIVNSTVKYDQKITASSTQISGKATAAIQNYADTGLTSFGEYFRQSVLSALIDQSDIGITNNLTTVTMEKRSVIDTTQELDYLIKYSNAIEQGTIVSSLFSYRSSGFIGGWYVSAGGTGYSNSSVVTITGAGLDAAATVTTGGGAITAVNITHAGVTKAPAVYAIDPRGAGNGSGARFKPVITNGQITSIVILDGGTGYSNTAGEKPVIQIVAGAGSGASVVEAGVTVAAGVITAISMNAVGTGYVPLPTISVADGTGATIVPMITYHNQISGVQYTAAGSGYTSAPTLAISTGSFGRYATATSVVASGAVTSATVTDPGYDYRSLEAPTLTISGGGGTGAKGVPVLTNVFDNVRFKDTVTLDYAYTRSGTTVTVTRPSHGFVVGQTIPVYGATDILMNDNDGYVITTVPDPDSFTFTVPGTVTGADKGQFGSDETLGFVGMFQQVTTVERPVYSYFTGVNYVLGSYTLNDFTVQSIDEAGVDFVRFQAKPQKEDVIPTLSQIIVIDPTQIFINTVVDG